jgi:hypothetical protein
MYVACLYCTSVCTCPSPLSACMHFHKLGFLKLQPSIPSDPFFLCHMTSDLVTALFLSLPNLYHNQSKTYICHPTTYACSSCIHNYKSWITLKHNRTGLLNQPATIFRHQYNHTKNASSIHHTMLNSKHQDNMYPYQKLRGRSQPIEC